MTDNETPEMFDRDYVSSLRQEAGKYRQQVRDLESQVAQVSKLEAQIKAVRVENELVRRGVVADPNWVPISDGQDPGEAVDSFLEKYPHLSPGEPQTSTKKNVPSVLPPKPNNVGAEGPPAKGSMGDRTVSELKRDPKARENVSALYRDLLRQSTHQGDN